MRHRDMRAIAIAEGLECLAVRRGGKHDLLEVRNAVGSIYIQPFSRCKSKNEFLYFVARANFRRFARAAYRRGALA
jgi:hypothetical protein